MALRPSCSIVLTIIVYLQYGCIILAQLKRPWGEEQLLMYTIRLQHFVCNLCCYLVVVYYSSRRVIMIACLTFCIYYESFFCSKLEGQILQHGVAKGIKIGRNIDISKM